MKPIHTLLLALLFSATSYAQQNTQTFTFQGNVFQQYIVPATGWYFLDASGGQGGPASNNSHIGGLGARMQGYVQLSAGDTLRIAVGGQGGRANGAGNNVAGGGGGGGSSIIKMTNGTYTPLLMAGGGGGGAANYNGSSGLASQSGGFSWGGTNGSGGGLGSNSSVYGGAGGAGYFADGGSHFNGNTRVSSGGQAYVSGNYGGTAYISNEFGGNGGWGGGGQGGPADQALSAHDGGGAGGGGYSGGGGGRNEGDGGGGGGSYVASSINTTGCIASDGVNSGNGSVSIEYLQYSNASVDTAFTFQGNVFQYFTVSATGYYMIKVRGAQGGDVNTSTGGKGAHMQGYLLLRAGEVIKIAAGGAGQNGQYGSREYPTYWTGGGGGGSSSVVTTENLPLIIAGGGGGAGYSNAGGNGLKDNSFSTTGSGGNGGSSGNYGSSGGGGYYSDGGVCDNNQCPSSRPGQSLLHGNYGGGSGFSIGGWGGGAQGADLGLRDSCNNLNTNCRLYWHNAPGGGGGGYSGGNGAQEGNSASGGGSYNASICGRSDSSGVNTGNGLVSIKGPNVSIDTVNTPGPSYTWAANGATYQHSGTYYYVDQANCIVRVLDLSIGGVGGCASYNRIDTTIVSCGSYTNPLNGRTYTENTTDSFRLGCNFYVVRLIVSSPRTVLAFVNDWPAAPCTGAFPQSIYSSNPHDHLTHELVECKNTTDTFYTAEVPYATSYSWQLPAGATGSSTTNRIVVSFGNNFNGGRIRVTPVNACGNGDTLSMNIVLPAHVPTGRLQISGPSAPHISGSYSVAPIAGATMYLWSVSNSQAVIVSGQGTPDIQLQALPGFTRANLSVVASNCKGNGARGNLPLSSNGGNLGAMIARMAFFQPADISAYPNPSNGQFTVSTPSLQTDATLEVYSTDGRLVYQQTIPSTATETTIDLRHPAAGLYQVRVIEGQVVQNLKVIVE